MITKQKLAAACYITSSTSEIQLKLNHTIKTHQLKF